MLKPLVRRNHHDTCPNAYPMYVYALSQTMLRACRTPPNESQSYTDDDACAAVCPVYLGR
jgi:hypothetical protein